MIIEASDLPLARMYRWERERPRDIFMTQPLGGGAVKDYTFAETLDEARRMGAHLASLGLPRGSKIAILSKNCAHFIMSDLAIWMAGHVSVALYPTFSANTIAYILQHSDARVLFVGKLDTWAQQRAAVPAEISCIAYPLAPPTDLPRWDDLVRATPPLAGEPSPAADETAALLYTSGSTGQAKGVEHTFASMTGATVSLTRIIDVTRADRMISYLPLAHAFERAAVEMMAFRSGLHLYFAEALDTFVEDMKRARPTIFHSVPRLWLKFQLGVHQQLPERKLRALLKIPILSGFVKRKILRGLGLDQARLAITGSAPVPPELVQWYRDLGLELLEGYAMSEDFCCSHISVPGRARAGYVGGVAPGVVARIGDDGEVLVKSPGNMKGYYKDPTLTAASYTDDGFFRTGDRGRYDADGRLQITGRVKELFKSSKGKYIAPAPIENLLNAHGHIELSCVTGAGLPQPIAIVQLVEGLRTGTMDRPAVEAALAALLARINLQVEEWEQLACVVVASDEWQIENGFLTPTMKLKRSAIDDRYAALLPKWFETKQKVIWPV